MDPRPVPPSAPPARAWLAKVMAHIECDPNSGCWLWSLGADKSGYGRVYLGKFRLLAHRASYLGHHGSLPDMDLLHSCDTPSCVNPAHLRPGSHLENMAERNARGRARGGTQRGEECPWAKIDAATVKAIRAEQRPGRIAAVDYGISPSHFYKVKRGERWPHA